jgi:(p)ppGpp synthase/HD superfamily hydrolase
MKIQLAKLFCWIAHYGQKRKYTGEPYYVHPFEVANILQMDPQEKPDTDGIIVALLHDTVEDTWVKFWMIRLLFGKQVEFGVMMLTDTPKQAGNRKLRKQMDRDRLAKAPAWVKNIKLADMISNSSSIAEHDPEFAKVYMKEKKEFLDQVFQGSKHRISLNLLYLARNIVRNYYDYF